MYNDLIEHFPAVIALVVLLGSACVYMFIHFFNRMEKTMDKLCEAMSHVVTRTECEQRHADLINFVQAIVGVTNCKTCHGKREGDVQ